MIYNLSKRARLTPPSPIRKLSPLAEKARNAGTGIYHLNIGQPDIKAPVEFFEGIKDFKSEIVAYEPSRGNQELCAAWSDYMNRSLDLKTKPEEFLITTGASEALLFAFMACCDSDEEIIIFDPTYANYIGFAALSGIRLVSVPTSIDDNFRLPELSTIISKITSKTRAILLCNPNNPTGTVYTQEEVKLILDICNERNIFLIIDETYREFVYTDAIPFSVFHLDGALDRAIIIDSLSKRFSLCGARIGCLISHNTEIMGAVRTMAQSRLATATIEQHASAYMLRHINDQFVKTVVTEYARRRDALFRSLSSIEGVTVQKPEGAFYSIVKLPVENAEDFCTFLLSEFSFEGYTTFLAPAAGFYMEEGRGKQEVRVAYVLNAEDLERAVRIIGEGLNAYREKRSDGT